MQKLITKNAPKKAYALYCIYSIAFVIEKYIFAKTATTKIIIAIMIIILITLFIMLFVFIG